MKLRETPLTPLDRVFTGGAIAYSPESLRAIQKAQHPASEVGKPLQPQESAGEPESAPTPQS
jgi:hypothetical protein